MPLPSGQTIVASCIHREQYANSVARRCYIDKETAARLAQLAATPQLAGARHALDSTPLTMSLILRWRQQLSRLPLARQLVLLAVMPTMLVAAIILATTTVQYLRGLQHMAHTNAQMLAYQLAAAANAPMARHNRRELLQLARTGIAKTDTLRIEIWSDEGELLARAAHNNALAGQRLQVSAPITAGVGGRIVVDMDVSALRYAQLAGWRNIMLILGLGLLAVVVGGIWTARRIGTPVRALGRAMERLGRGEMVTVSETGHGEIGQLQRNFNQAARLLEAHQLGLEARVRDATTELEHKNQQLQSVNQARVRLLAAASHDLRQPLHALMLFSDGLAHEEPEMERRQRIRRIQECVSQLEHMFSELLAFTRLDTGALQPRYGQVALDRVFADINRTFGPVAAERMLRLSIRPTRLWVRSDASMLTRVVANLVSNALHNTTDGGVLLAARKHGRTAQIEIIDTGVGIDSAHQQHIFDEFYRIESPTDARGASQQGLGLGLATVHRLSQLLNMPLELRSTVGKGTWFRLRVPLTDVRPDTPSPRMPPQPLVPASVVMPRPLRVLALDDQQAILDGLRGMLAPWNCQFVAARDEQEALAGLDRLDGKLHVLLCDLSLRRGRSGLDVAARIAAHPHGCGPQTARLVVTGETDPRRLQAAHALGYAVLNKPVAPTELRAAIVRQWRQQQAGQPLPPQTERANASTLTD